MKASKTLIAAAIAALIPLGAAVAADNGYGEKDKAPSFDKLDTNHDGRISQTEAAADSQIVFSSADANGDGYIDSKEFKAASKKGSASPAPQSESTPPADPSMQQPSTTTPQPDTETPRQ